MTHGSTGDPLTDPRVQAVARALGRRSPRTASQDRPAGSPDAVPFASVALVVRPGEPGPEALLIRRATFEGDPWSGHVALPGGRREPLDRTPVDTAIRETREEVGIDLVTSGRLIGDLDEVSPRRGGPLVSVSAHVFAVPRGTGVILNREVESALWVPVRHLADAASAIEHIHTLPGGERRSFPAIGYADFVIWGLTHRILTQFCEVISAGGEDVGF